MDNYYYNYSYHNLVTQIEQNVSNIAKLNEEIVDLYKVIQQIIKSPKYKNDVQNDVDVKNNKDKKETKKNKTFPDKTIRICKFFNKGFCKFKSLCSFFHPKTNCVIENCKDKLCEKRHIIECKNWKKGNCKFIIPYTRLELDLSSYRH